jgi:hypothetical protein
MTPVRMPGRHHTPLDVEANRQEAVRVLEAWLEGRYLTDDVLLPEFRRPDTDDLAELVRRLEEVLLTVRPAP